MKFGDVFELPLTGYRVMVINNVAPNQTRGYTEVIALNGRPGAGVSGDLHHVGTNALLGRTSNSPWSKVEAV